MSAQRYRVEMLFADGATVAITVSALNESDARRKAVKHSADAGYGKLIKINIEVFDVWPS